MIIRPERKLPAPPATRTVALSTVRGDVAPPGLATPSMPPLSPPLSNAPVKDGPGATDSLVEIVWRQRKFVGAVIAAALLCGLLYLLVATPIYTSNATLWVRPGAPSLLTQTQYHPSNDDDSFLFTQRQLLVSTPVIALALETPGIHDLRTFKGQGSPFAYLKKYLSVDVGKKDQLLYVSFDTPEKDEANEVVAAVTDAYTRFQSTQRQQAADNVLVTLRAEETKWQAELTTKTQALLDYRRANNMVSGTTANQRLTAVDQALTAARLAAVNAQAEHDEVAAALLADPTLATRVEAVRKSQGTIAPTDEDAAMLREQLLRAQAALQQIQREYGPAHPAVKTAQGQVDQLQVAHAAAVEARWQAAVSREAELQQLYDQEQKKAIEQNAAGAQEAQLKADVDDLQQTVDKIANRIREVNLTNDDEAVSVSTVDPPQTEEKPTHPSKLRSLAAALCFGLVVGGAGAVARDHYDRRLRSADEVRAVLGVPVLGEIPAMSGSLSPAARAKQVHDDSTSPLADACRTVRDAILATGPAGRVRTILVASPSRGDGRTTIASNLALSLAEGGKRVLLLDADLRSPMQDWVYGVGGGTGLANALEADGPVAIEPPHLSIEPAVDHLDLLPAGRSSVDPAMLLNGERFDELLELLADAYDHLVIDTPPVGATADARIVAASCDATVVVLRPHRHSRRLGQQTRELLSSVGANVVGVVLNEAPSLTIVSGPLDGGASGEPSTAPPSSTRGPRTIVRREPDADQPHLHAIDRNAGSGVFSRISI